MQPATLIADSGATKTEWCLLNKGRKKIYSTQGISPYFLSEAQITQLVSKELLPSLKNASIEKLFYYGTGCKDINNANMVKRAMKKIFTGAHIEVTTDLLGAARSLCGNKKGIVCNLGTGIFSCYYDGKKIIKDRPGDGYVLGDEGGGAYLGKKVIQHFLYGIFDEELAYKFNDKYHTNRDEILQNVYKKPFPNRYLASFALFLAENRRHYMIENIIEDGLNDFFFYHLNKYGEAWKMPINFVGSISFGFKDVVEQLCKTYGFDLGIVLKAPMDGLIQYHQTTN
jgi:N-acetylglucosamine kinase-like BadF-type ATPase